MTVKFSNLTVFLIVFDRFHSHMFTFRIQIFGQHVKVFFHVRSYLVMKSPYGICPSGTWGIHFAVYVFST